MPISSNPANKQNGPWIRSIPYNKPSRDYLNLPWKRHYMEMLSVLQSFWEKNPPVIGGYKGQIKGKLSASVVG